MFEALLNRVTDAIHDVFTSKAWTWEDEAKQMADDRPAILASKARLEHDEYHRRYPSIHRGSILCGFCHADDEPVHLDLRRRK